MAWSTFLKSHPARHTHLVVAGVPIDTDADLGTRHLQTLHGRLSKLMTRLAPEGAYSVTIVRQAGAPEIHAAFEKRDDANRLARAVGARADSSQDAGASPDWASRRFFVLDEATGAAIAASLVTDGALDERQRDTNPT
ncbi:MAG: hypothetical protein ACT4O6_26115 [Reyranella sp.]